MRKLPLLLFLLTTLSGCAGLVYKPDRVTNWPGLGMRIAVLVVTDSSKLGAGKRKFLVRAVRPDTPAEKAGVKSGDVLLALDDKIIHSISDALEIMRNKKTNNSVVLTVMRGDTIVVLTANLANALPRSSI